MSHKTIDLRVSEAVKIIEDNREITLNDLAYKMQLTGKYVREEIVPMVLCNHSNIILVYGPLRLIYSSPRRGME